MTGRVRDVALRIEKVGADLVCRIDGGRSHVGAVTLACWDGRRATTRLLEVAGHRESDLAMHAAHRLCAAARTTVVCIAGIHFDGLERPDIDAIVDHVTELVTAAACDLEARRLSSALGRGTLAARIRSGARRRVASVARSLATPLAALAEPRPAVLASARGFSGEVVLYAPLYLSSACLNDCAYCGFRKSLRIPRRKLSLDEAISEARVLESRGHRTIDLVTGEIPTDRFVAYVADVVTAIRGATAIRTINLNLGALLQDQLARLRDAGASAYHIYQETYDPGVYAAVHGPGPKRDMAFRLATAHRAAEAGFESVGLGILLGLAPLSEDLAALASHAALLRRTFPALGIGFSLPRIQDVELGPSFATPAPVGDAVFARAVLYLRTTFPRAHVSITTREAPAIRDALMRLGATKLSAGVSTAPGGYGAPERAGQFAISDHRSFDDVARAVRDAGLEPVAATRTNMGR